MQLFRDWNGCSVLVGEKGWTHSQRLPCLSDWWEAAPLHCWLLLGMGMLIRFCPEPAWRVGGGRWRREGCLLGPSTTSWRLHRGLYIGHYTLLSNSVCNHNGKCLVNDLMRLMTAEAPRVIKELLLLCKTAQVWSQCNQVVSLSVFIAKSSAQRRHRYEEGCNHQRCMWIHETAASGAGWMGKIHPSILWAPTWWPGKMQTLPCQPTACDGNSQPYLSTGESDLNV